ncbi:MAG: hypothetical protein NWE93_09655 [Candidatus Bathyarchaeota archaeon]|nr:hypothetical protein [Candidatus Bathyarchaeota archaeon]
MDSKPKPEMDTDFCRNWIGDRKSKHCRLCAAPGAPCFALWEAVKALAARNLVLVNPKQGHRYRLEPPKRSPMLIYIQTLQDKGAHFGLPIEDFLYVAKTGRGGMYMTPSRTKQQPFVDLILQQISSDPAGAGLVGAVRSIPQKNR